MGKKTRKLISFCYTFYYKACVITNFLNRKLEGSSKTKEDILLFGTFDDLNSEDIFSNLTDDSDVIINGLSKIFFD